MGRKLVLVALAVVAGLIGYNFVTTGEMTLIPASSRSPEMRQMEDLEARVRSAGNAITGAGRTAGLTGMDTTGDVEASMRALERAEKEIELLRQKSTSEEIRGRCDRLLSESRRMRGAR